MLEKGLCMRIEITFYGKTIARVLRMLKLLHYKRALTYWRTMSHYHYARKASGHLGQPDITFTI